MSWQYNDKLDPSFHEMVKTFLDIVKKVREIPCEGFIAMEVGSNDSVINRAVEDDNTTSVDFQIRALNETLAKVLFVPVDRLRNERDAYFRDLFELVKMLPNRSKQYYLDIMEGITNGKLIKSVDHLKGDKRKKRIKANSTVLSRLICSLSTRYYFFNMNLISEKEDDLFDNPEVANLYLNSIYSFISQIAFLGKVGELIKKGDDDSILRAIRIDKYALYTESARMRIIRAQISGDSKFLNRLSYAIKDKPLKKIDIHHETYMVLKYFWLMGLDGLKYEELYYFLKNDCGIIPPAYPHSFEPFVREKIKPLYQ